jgi:5'(3')-deoxyribonucleotidase
MRLGIDLDGVVADFNGGWIGRYNTQFAAGLSLDAVRHWGGILDVTHFADMAEFWAWARHQDGASIFRYLEPYPGALEALHRLERAGHEIVILTFKPDWALPDTFSWLGEHRVPTREVHVTDHKHLVACDVYLDDAPHQLKRIGAVRPQSTTCRFVRPWNRPIPGTIDVVRWGEFEELVAHLAGMHTEPR